MDEVVTVRIRPLFVYTYGLPKMTLWRLPARKNRWKSTRHKTSFLSGEDIFASPRTVRV